MNFNAVILRDIPKEEARIDLFRQTIQGGFRGFYADVPIIGWHYVSVKVKQFHVGFWCDLSMNQAVVRVFDEKKGFVEDTPESAQRYAQMALSGAMQQVLMPYPVPMYAHWFGMVSHIKSDHFPPQIHNDDTGTGSRLDKALLGTHKGRIDAFLAEFQYAFVRWLVSLDTATEDKAGLARWRYLLLSAYNAGEDRIREFKDLFSDLVSTLLRQFELLPKEWFKKGSFLTEQANYMVEDMLDSGVPQLAEQAQAFAAYLEKH